MTSSHALVRFLRKDFTTILKISDIKEFSKKFPEASDVIDKNKIYAGKYDDKYASIQIYATGSEAEMIKEKAKSKRLAKKKFNLSDFVSDESELSKSSSDNDQKRNHSNDSDSEQSNESESVSTKRQIKKYKEKQKALSEKEQKAILNERLSLVKSASTIKSRTIDTHNQLVPSTSRVSTYESAENTLNHDSLEEYIQELETENKELKAEVQKLRYLEDEVKCLYTSINELQNEITELKHKSPPLKRSSSRRELFKESNTSEDISKNSLDCSLSQASSSGIQSYEDLASPSVSKKFKKLKTNSFKEMKTFDASQVTIDGHPPTFAVVEDNEKKEKMIHLGYGVYIEKYTWKHIRTSKKGSLFVKNLARAIWKDELANRCLTLKESMKKQDSETRKIVTPSKMDTIKSCYEFWLKTYRSDVIENDGLKGTLKKVRGFISEEINYQIKCRKEAQKKTKASEDI